MTTAADVGRVVTDLCESLFDLTVSIRDRVTPRLEESPVRRSDLDVEEHCRALLVDPATRIAGAGLVMAPGLLEDATYWLEWWTSDPDAPTLTPRRLATVTDPRAIGFRDYTQLPWYATPFETGSRHVTGPYVDYLCTDEHTLTFTTPLLRDGQFAGVAGVDLLVRTLEEKVFDALAAVPEPCAVVNSRGRVITTADPGLVTGDLVRDIPIEAWVAGEDVAHERWAWQPCPGLPLGVLHAPSGLPSGLPSV